MNLKSFLFLAACLSTIFTLPLPAASTFKDLQAAAKLRADMAAAILAGSETVAHALSRLQTSGIASGLTLSKDADCAYAALDVGHRLLAMDRPAAAELFFRAAETLFEKLANQTLPTQAHDKAEYLQKLALIRAKYLNKVAQAKANIDTAVALRPEDKSLAEARSELASGHAQDFKAAGTN